MTQTLQFHELEEGETCEVVLTSLGGLYRYAMCDMFKVVGFVGRVPRMEYYGRRSVSDLTGEKLAEEHVEHVVTAGLSRRSVEGASFAMCAVDTDDPNDRPKYVLVLETHDEAWPTSEVEGLAAELDREFRIVNSRYDIKRNFGDLKRLEIQPVSSGTFVRYRERLVEQGMPAGQIKDKALHKDGTKVMSELLKLSDECAARARQ